MARPTKLTDSVQQRIVSAVAAANYYEAAAAYGGVDYRTLLRWMQRGEKAKDGIYRQFCQAVRQAEADSEVAIVATVRQSIPDNPRLGLDFLARRFPDRWGPKERHVVEGDAERPLTIRTLTVNVPLLANGETLLLIEGDGTMEGE